MVMYVGKIAEISDAESLFLKPLHPYTEALLSAIPKADPKAKRKEENLLAGDVADPANIPTGCCFHPRCRYAIQECRNEIPLLRRIEDGTAEKASGRQVACHRANELTLQGET
jgi:peptide/nickel transport system ATP-binding protein